MKPLIKLSNLLIALVIYMGCAIYGVPAVAQRLDAGTSHSCVILANGGVSCWGLNNSGQLGNGRTTDSSLPVIVNNLNDRAIAVTAGYNHTCALTSTGAVLCWGLNNRGQLGNGTTIDAFVPVYVNDLGGPASAIAAGRNHTCALLSTGGVFCWGANNRGQLGNGTITDFFVPVPVSNLNLQTTAITAGDEHTCALMSSGAVKCWGGNFSGQLGNGRNGRTRDSSVPVTVHKVKQR